MYKRLTEDSRPKELILPSALSFVDLSCLLMRVIFECPLREAIVLSSVNAAALNCKEIDAMK